MTSYPQPDFKKASDFGGGGKPRSFPIYTAVDDYTNAQLIVPNNKFHDVLEATRAHSELNELPDIAVSPTQGKFLALLAHMKGATHLLEIGTLGAYSTIWFASLNPGMKIVTVENSPRHIKVARENISRSGFEDQIELLQGPGAALLPVVLEDIETGKRPKFDFVFIDADKENNWLYFDIAVKMCAPGACVIVDNVVRGGGLADAELAETDSRVRGSRQVVEEVGRDARVDGVVTMTAGEKGIDGFLMALVK